MRKIMVMLMLGIVSGITIAQENKKEQTVPADVVEAFSMLYPNVKEVNWKDKEKDFEANFVQNEKVVSLLFDRNGNLKEVKNKIKESELPISVNGTLTKEYPDWKIRKAARVDIRGTGTYEVEVEKGEQTMVLIFSVSGVLLNKFINDLN